MSIFLKAGSFFAAALGALLLNAAEPAASSGEAATHFQMLDKFCDQCHNATDWAGGVAFDTMTPETIATEAKVWEEAVRKLRGRLMPPPGEDQPAQETLDNFVSWMEGRLDAHAFDKPNPGHVSLHRINRTEYARAVEQLLAVKINPAAILPRETKSDGFDNVANVLRVSPTFLDQYISAARTVSVLAVGEPNARAIGQTYRAPPARQAFYQEGMPLGTRGGMEIEHWFPADGEYEFTIRVPVGGGYGLGLAEQTLIFKVDNKRLLQQTLGGEEDSRAIDQRQAPAAAEIAARFQKIRVPVSAGPHKVTITFVQTSYSEGESLLFPFVPGGGSDSYARVAAVDIMGPFNPRGISETPSRRKIFHCRPATVAEEPVCAKQIVARLAREAFRRPVNDEDLKAPLQFYAEGRQLGSFDTGIQTAIMAILSSPKFLYRIESTPNLPVGTVYALDDLSIASRLSFFLWSQGPDDVLLDLAAAGKLREPMVLEQQVTRMLADDRARSLVTNFAYQWLNIEGLNDVDPDPAFFPSFDADLRSAYVREMELFVDSVLRSDRNVTDLLTSNYTFVNERLALHYGIPDIRGDQFRRVQLVDSKRWGLLGKGAFLMLTSYGNRTAPVLRGAYILERITSTPPKAPPPGVEALKDNQVGTKLLTVRERLEEHRVKPSCNACHGVMDPLGFALENFDAVGAWREVDREANTKVDAGAVTADGRKLAGPDDLRNMLASKPEQFVQAITEKLLIYALGRTVEFHDMPRVRAIVKEAKSKDYQFSALISGIVRSEQFLLSRVEAPTSTTAESPKLTRVDVAAK
jgi:mono/diheme cytochrome c family protein